MFLVLLCFQFCLEAIAVLFGLVFSVVCNSIGLIAVSSPSHGKAIATAAPNDCKAIVNALQRLYVCAPTVRHGTAIFGNSQKVASAYHPSVILGFGPLIREKNFLAISQKCGDKIFLG